MIRMLFMTLALSVSALSLVNCRSSVAVDVKAGEGDDTSEPNATKITIGKLEGESWKTMNVTLKNEGGNEVSKGITFEEFASGKDVSVTVPHGIYTLNVAYYKDADSKELIYQSCPEEKAKKHDFLKAAATMSVMVCSVNNGNDPGQNQKKMEVTVKVVVSHTPGRPGKVSLTDTSRCKEFKGSQMQESSMFVELNEFSATKAQPAICKLKGLAMVPAGYTIDTGIGNQSIKGRFKLQSAETGVLTTKLAVDPAQCPAAASGTANFKGPASDSYIEGRFSVVAAKDKIKCEAKDRQVPFEIEIKLGIQDYALTTTGEHDSKGTIKGLMPAYTFNFISCK